MASPLNKKRRGSMLAPSQPLSVPTGGLDVAFRKFGAVLIAGALFASLAACGDDDTEKHGRDHRTDTALGGVDLHVDEHDVVCLIGPSGCGKSTLMRCINALSEIDEGAIPIDGEQASGRKVDLDGLRQEVGIVFQGSNLFPHMTVLDNVTLAPARCLVCPASRPMTASSRCCHASASTTRPATSPTGSPAASSSAWPSCEPSPSGRGCCSTR
jgi:ABC transporter